MYLMEEKIILDDGWTKNTLSEVESVRWESKHKAENLEKHKITGKSKVVELYSTTTQVLKSLKSKCI